MWFKIVKGWKIKWGKQNLLHHSKHNLDKQNPRLKDKDIFENSCPCRFWSCPWLCAILAEIFEKHYEEWKKSNLRLRKITRISNYWNCLLFEFHVSKCTIKGYYLQESMYKYLQLLLWPPGSKDNLLNQQCWCPCVFCLMN